MNIIKKNKATIALFAALLILIIFRLSGPGHFKIDAKKLAEPSFTQANILSVENLATLKGELVINLGDESTKTQGIEDVISIEPGLLLKRIDIIKKHKGPVVLFSSDTAVSARIWMLLSQMGYKDLFILTGNEVLKYKFRPDTLTSPEL